MTANDEPEGGDRAEENAAAPSASEPSRDAIIATLKTIEDPEIFLDIWFLGLIYNIGIDGAKVHIEMTFTSPMCPYGPVLVKEVQDKVGQVEGVKEVEVQVVFTPPWEPNDEVKAMMGFI